MAGSVPTAWLDRACDKLTPANVRAEAEARGLSLRAVMRLYYRHDRMRAATLLFYWKLARDDFFSLSGTNRYALFLKDLREALVEMRVETSVIQGSDQLGEERLCNLKRALQTRALQTARPQQDEQRSSRQARRRRGGNRKRRDARRRERQLHAIPVNELPPPVQSMGVVRANIQDKDFLPEEPASTGQREHVALQAPAAGPPGPAGERGASGETSR
jgi:hypothetical protein